MPNCIYVVEICNFKWIEVFRQLSKLLDRSINHACTLIAAQQIPKFAPCKRFVFPARGSFSIMQVLHVPTSQRTYSLVSSSFVLHLINSLLVFFIFFEVKGYWFFYQCLYIR